mgnify:CR=1 FL=1
MTGMFLMCIEGYATVNCTRDTAGVFDVDVWIDTDLSASVNIEGKNNIMSRSIM